MPLTGAEPGSVTGTVSNAATRNLLPGARVEIAPLGLSALTDDTGRYVLAGVPAGSTSSSSPTSVWTPSGAP
ncbi:MAG: carboxypeptidase-like regulatory domain-containing protein [Verrucomicrobia bacterium]|nr:carboxypeptidase-like regulatory domain-containing protein [Verrucomicrobiota bacterium]